ncbi:ATP-binding protein [Halomicrobium urmianum]|uniref:ATP-binding protein n=1 Tax=Halomicrobium urmianum TaxID=1586233 RepID=UPI001CD9808A|nr:ATP-binding protein [Halomicrobium urmianum]
MNLLLAAASGWGKSWMCQATTEENLDEYDAVCLLDYKDEYRGLVKGGMAKHWIAGPVERDQWTGDHYRQLLEQNGNVVLARHSHMSEEDWRQVCAQAVQAGRRSSLNILWVIDEAHFVAPQRGGLLDPIKGLATTGRGEGQSAAWITQRLSEINETILAQCTARQLGGFESDQDLSKLAGVVEYPEEVHRSGGHKVVNLPDDLADDDGPISVRKWKDDSGAVTGSEWIYSDDSGARERINSADVEMTSEHVGAPGKEIHIPS